jgi:hypothetical protein
MHHIAEERDVSVTREIVPTFGHSECFFADCRVRQPFGEAPFDVFSVIPGQKIGQILRSRIGRFLDEAIELAFPQQEERFATSPDSHNPLHGGIEYRPRSLKVAGRKVRNRINAHDANPQNPLITENAASVANVQRF